MLFQTWSLLRDKPERTQPGVMSLKRMACFACGGQVRVLLCAWCRAVQDEVLLFRKGLTLRGLVPRWLCQKAGGKETF